MLNFVGEIRDTVHKYVKFSDLEKKVIDTPYFQRLRRIKQLALADLTYPCANYSRFPHSTGTMHVAGKIAEKLKQKEIVSEDEIQKIRLAAMLHDLGHGPFSHMFEEILAERRNLTHEDLTTWLIENTEISDIIKENGFDPNEISKLSIGKSEKNQPYVNQIISGYFDSDVMDFLLRDSLHTGVEYGIVDIDRIIDSLDVVDDNLAVDYAALYALESFYFARYMMFKAVYFHKTVRAADVMISKAMFLADEKIGLTSFKSPEEYLNLVDDYVINEILKMKNEPRELKLAKDLVLDLNNRNLFKTALEAIMHHENKHFSSLVGNPNIRHSIEKEIAKKAKIDENYVILDLSTVPSLPFRPFLEERERIGAAYIPVVIRRGPSVSVRSLLDVSPIVGELKGFVDIVRVYTSSNYREQVAEAAKTIFEEGSYFTKVSF
jgi:hypothetical protein